MKLELPAILIVVSLFIVSSLSCAPGDTSTQSQNSSEKSSETEATAKAMIHPDFHITVTQLKEEIAEEPQEIQQKILERPEYFLELIKKAIDLPEWALVLVDKENSLGPEYSPEELVRLRDYNLSLNRASLELSRVCMPAVLAMTEAARADGVELVYSSTYRPYEYQKQLYEGYVDRHGQKEADRFSARPGTSQHQLGTTIDFGSITPEFGDTAAGKWLYENAWKYGFSLSYPDGQEELTGYMFEIWHYRYITRTGTILEKEFFLGLQQHLTEFLHRHRSFFSQNLQPHHT